MCTHTLHTHPNSHTYTNVNRLHRTAFSWLAYISLEPTLIKKGLCILILNKPHFIASCFPSLYRFLVFFLVCSFGYASFSSFFICLSPNPNFGTKASLSPQWSSPIWQHQSAKDLETPGGRLQPSSFSPAEAVLELSLLVRQPFSSSGPVRSHWTVS